MRLILKTVCHKVLQARDMLCDADEALNKDAGKIRSLFRKIDYAKHHERASAAHKHILDMVRVVDSLNDRPELADDPLAQQMLTQLQAYVQALQQAAEAYGKTVAGLHDKAQGANADAYPWNEYQRDLKEYEQYSRQYASIGPELEALYHQM